MPIDKSEAPVRDNAEVEVTIAITRQKNDRYSSDDKFVAVEQKSQVVLAIGEGTIEDNHSTFVNLLEQVLGSAKGNALEQLEQHAAALRADREKREAKERAAAELEES